ncbi:MAG: 4-deoxy-4-formamido-L-arabinose-phosphoundecaprenol deformylase [Proteobacteria bacterium]|nr:4-deoxy-4-formamido-L-arabinose-phosphoundecaprenol deformylase [Pseudomonadota bacterium]MBU1650031.1 4-deoxy-4-formamido-L-arabinose-phosphoundecaprenol deformylase [Pseudomonadota bacterium]
MQIGLRIDVDTLRGTRIGVPELCRILKENEIKASFFFSVGPDNMGRHLWRLLRPSFFLKMMRTKAASLYGWDILLKGTFWPGPSIAGNAGQAIQHAATEGHEIGLHAWDHHGWQSGIKNMPAAQVQSLLNRGCDILMSLTGKKPTCSAAPAWRSTDTALLAKDNFAFLYNSDCRGDCIFYPQVAGKTLQTPQVPTTLPTFDELIGQAGVTEKNYNEQLFSHLRSDRLNILTIHAEVEGIVHKAMFADFIRLVQEKGYSFVPLGKIIKEAKKEDIVVASIQEQIIPGREGWISIQH